MRYELKPGESSHIKSFDYDEKSKDLKVSFMNGRHYTFLNVTPEAARNFASDSSKGKFFHQVIKRSYHQKLSQ